MLFVGAARDLISSSESKTKEWAKQQIDDLEDGIKDAATKKWVKAQLDGLGAMIALVSLLCVFAAKKLELSPTVPTLGMRSQADGNLRYIARQGYLSFTSVARLTRGGVFRRRGDQAVRLEIGGGQGGG